MLGVRGLAGEAGVSLNGRIVKWQEMFAEEPRRGRVSGAHPDFALMDVTDIETGEKDIIAFLQIVEIEDE